MLLSSFFDKLEYSVRKYDVFEKIDCFCQILVIL